MSSSREQALRRAYDDHATEVVRIAARLLRDPEEARDVCQEAFVRLHDRLDDVDDPAPWLRAVAWRLSLDALRRRRLLARGLETRARDRAPGEPDPLEAEDVRVAVARALGLLSEQQRAVVALRILGEETFPEIARALGTAEGTAKVHLRRGLERLRSALAPLVSWERTS